MAQLLVPNKPVGVVQKLLMYWNFPAQSSQESGLKNKKYRSERWFFRMNVPCWCQRSEKNSQHVPSWKELITTEATSSRRPHWAPLLTAKNRKLCTGSPKLVQLDSLTLRWVHCTSTVTISNQQWDVVEEEIFLSDVQLTNLQQRCKLCKDITAIWANIWKRSKIVYLKPSFWLTRVEKGMRKTTKNPAMGEIRLLWVICQNSCTTTRLHLCSCCDRRPSISHKSNRPNLNYGVPQWKANICQLAKEESHLLYTGKAQAVGAAVRWMPICSLYIILTWHSGLFNGYNQHVFLSN